MSNKHNQPIAIDDFGNEVWKCPSCGSPANITDNHDCISRKGVAYIIHSTNQVCTCRRVGYDDGRVHRTHSFYHFSTHAY